MAKRSDYGTDTKFPSYEKAMPKGEPGTDSEKDSLGDNADGPLGYLGKTPDYIAREFTDADLAAGGCDYDMPQWSDPPYPMNIGRIEASRQGENKNDGGDLLNGAKLFKSFKHQRIRQGVETPDMINGDEGGEGGGGFY